MHVHNYKKVSKISKIIRNIWKLTKKERIELLVVIYSRSLKKMKNESFVFTPTPAAASIQTSLYLVLILTGVLGNGTICFLMIRFKALRTMPNILLTNLAIIDLLNIIINAPFLILSEVYHLEALYTKTAAWWTSMLSILFVLLNLSTIFFLILDRSLALAHCFKYRLWRTRRKVLCAICAMWIWPVFISGCISIPL